MRGEYATTLPTRCAAWGATPRPAAKSNARWSASRVWVTPPSHGRPGPSSLPLNATMDVSLQRGMPTPRPAPPTSPIDATAARIWTPTPDWPPRSAASLPQATRRVLLHCCANSLACRTRPTGCRPSSACCKPSSPANATPRWPMRLGSATTAPPRSCCCWMGCGLRGVESWLSGRDCLRRPQRSGSITALIKDRSAALAPSS